MQIDQHSARFRFPRPRRPLVIASAAALSLLLTPALAGAQSAGPEKDITRQVQEATPISLPSMHPLVQRVLPAVVNISAQLGDENSGEGDRSADEGTGNGNGDEPNAPFDQFLKKFFENRGLPQLHREVMALGSGFIIDPSGYVVTNNHVVGDSHKITVIFQDNSRHPAKVIGRDEKTDLALLKIDAKEKLPFVSWGDSEKTEVGDWIVAVGNPFGLGGTVTAGIVSALGRNIDEGPYDDFIQLDAPINRGNSGGPTFNLSGQVIGINTAIYSPSGGSVGIGFAIPSNTAKNVIEQIEKTGHVTRGWLGVAIQGITPAIARSFGMNPDQPSGALVASVNPNSPAAKAGVKQGDVILSAGSHPIKSVHDLPRLVAATPPGQQLALDVQRDGKHETIGVTVGEMPNNPQVASAEGGGATETTSLGMQLSSITTDLRGKYRIPRDVDGVVVAKIASDSPAAALGIQTGDVIQSIDQQPVKMPEEAAAALTQAAKKGNVLLLLNRHGVSQFVALSVTPGMGSGNPG